ncbi:hypothetical protein EG329_003773 [Mollisiaceae sp. DMI_Dod_QoI]|nr:hypothetical protein EG329_003773 [Helotiales sp. DMI_Dod_QoI]
MKLSLSYVVGASLAIQRTAAMVGTPTVCMSGPAVTAQAGAMLTATVNNNSQGKPCKATLSFPNADFLPVYFDFLGVGCTGLEILEFTVPMGVPNGDAYISWLDPLLH